MNEIIIEKGSLPQVVYVGRYRVEEDWLHLDRIAPVNSLILVDEGCFYVSEEDKDYVIEAGQCIFFKKGCHHYGKRKIRKGSKWYWVSFLLEDEKSMINKIHLPKVINFRDESALKTYKDILLSLDKQLSLFNERPTHYKEELKALLYRDFFRLLRVSKVDLREEQGEKSISVKVVNLLEEGLYQAFSSARIAEGLNMNYNYVTRKFKEERGKTIVEFNHELKIYESIRLLKSKSLSISQVSDMMAFANPYYYSRIFKKVTGLSPREYIKQTY